MSVFVMCSVTILFFSDIDLRMKAEPKSAAEFYAVYKRYNLWLPPKDAKLIRWVDNHISTGSHGLSEEKIVHLEILVRAKTKTEPAIVRTPYPEYIEHRDSRLKVVSPTISALDGIEMYSAENWLTLAACAQHLGWTDLATEAFLRGKTSPGSGQYPDDVTGSPCHTLAIVRKMAWGRYSYSLIEIDTDRSNAYTNLKKIRDDDWHYHELASDLFDDLERTLHKTKADLEGIEGNITRLCDEDTNFPWLEDLTGSPTAYDEICHLGFDAVPFLIAHLNDTRLTRSHTPNSFGNMISIDRVGGVCGNILSELSDSEYKPEHNTSLEERRRLATVWFANAKKIGEEKWASTHAVQMRTTNPALLRLLAAKYPKRLIEIYRDVLKNDLDISSAQIVAALIHADLPLQEKIDRLLEATHHRRKIHRLDAIKGLEVLDNACSTRALTKHFLRLADEPQTNEEIAVSSFEIELLWKANDEKCWDAFIRCLKKAPPSNRIYVLDYLVPDSGPLKIARYAHHFRAMESLWSDTEIRNGNVKDQLYPAYQYPKLTVGDAVTLQFAKLMDIEVPWKRTRTSEEWTTIRHQVQTAWSEHKIRGAGG